MGQDPSQNRGSVDLPDFRLVLFRHLDRIGQLFATEFKDGVQQKHINISRVDAVDLFEAMMTPYHDEIYEKEEETITNDPDTHEDDRIYAKKKYSALIKLLGRKRFLPEEVDQLDEGLDI